MPPTALEYAYDLPKYIIMIRMGTPPFTPRNRPIFVQEAGGVCVNLF